MAKIEDFTDDQVVSAYLKIRDARAEANRIASEKDQEFKFNLDRLGNELLRRMMERKNEGFSTKYGSVSRIVDFQPSAESWDEVYHWIVSDAVEEALKEAKLSDYHNRKIRETFKKNALERFELLEKRLKKTAVKEHMEANATLDPKTGKKVLASPPPGVRVVQEFVARVRVNNKG